jgi:hypothetical protein
MYASDKRGSKLTAEKLFMLRVSRTGRLGGLYSSPRGRSGLVAFFP